MCWDGGDEPAFITYRSDPGPESQLIKTICYESTRIIRAGEGERKKVENNKKSTAKKEKKIMDEK